ncbi:sulfurtransferase [Humibacter ginsenosidimutans]|uniref:Sulfurtransferase n=1 Tax=Humibacter ginsenosidimutans TaxID=2599293 RepID=A0A5B8M1N7_9MICO|nr:rhodanese-like domain-containing protein [Humibacter ginsenosidimutans]QDZ14537.1 sulfurtransferase [Humibacter ginsenosidimutans]
MTSIDSPSPPRSSSPLAATARRHLIGTDELAALLADADRAPGTGGVLVVDATVLQVAGFDGHPAYVTGHEQYLVNGHVPGAVFADLLEEFSDAASPFPFTRPTAEQFALAAATLGVDAQTSVVIYDDAVGQWASRLWWLFRSFGHDDVAVLDGGLRKWAAEKRPLEIGHVAPSASQGFEASTRHGFWADKDRVDRALAGHEPATLLCGLPPREFTGETGHRPRLGHIPGSLSAPASRLVDRQTNAFLDDDALRALLSDAVTSPAPVVTYCAGGVAAAADALALALLGRDDVALYDGSLNEWAADETRPLVVIATNAD